MLSMVGSGPKKLSFHQMLSQGGTVPLVLNDNGVSLYKMFYFSLINVCEVITNCPSTLVSIFGLPYIKRLFRDRSRTYSRDGIDIKGNVTALRFIAGIDGIRAIRLFGDDWESDWLGSIPRSIGFWHGAIKGPLPGIRCRYNVRCSLSHKSFPPYHNSILLF